MNRILSIASTHELLAQSGVDEVMIGEVITNIKNNTMRYFSNPNCSATSFLRNWDSILEKKRANLRSISEPARLRQPPPEARERHTQEGGLKAYRRSDE